MVYTEGKTPFTAMGHDRVQWDAGEDFEERIKLLAVAVQTAARKALDGFCTHGKDPKLNRKECLYIPRKIRPYIRLALCLDNGPVSYPLVLLASCSMRIPILLLAM